MRRLKLLLLVVLISNYAYAQVTTEGTEFWLGFMQNSDDVLRDDLGNIVTGPGGVPINQSSLEIFITSKEEANVEIFNYSDNSSKKIRVFPEITHQEVVSVANNNPYAAFGSESVEKKGIRITSDTEISVYAFNNRVRSADATVVLPSKSLGREYFVTSYWEDTPYENSASEFLIVATQNDTKVEVTPSVNTLNGRAAGVPFTLSLNQGDIYQVQAEGDLTGSFIKASEDSGDCKNFAVFGGNQWGIITMGQDCSTTNGTNPDGYAPDHLFEQMYPTNTWGRNYVAFPFELRRNYGLRVLALEDGTQVTVGGQNIELNSGEYETFVLEDLTAINADRPVQVAQFSFSLSCDNNTTTGSGDPFMIMLNPNEQQLQEINFNALNASELDNYFLTIITESDNIDNLFLNGVKIDAAQFQSIPDEESFSYGNFTIQKASDYNLVSDGGFVAYIYAFGFIESFGYVAGASLENLNLQARGKDEFIDIIADQACLGANIDFTALFETPTGQEPRFNTFDWDFGDDTQAEGMSVTKKYDEPGFYDITLVASDGQGSCGTSESIIRTIEIVATNVSSIIGSTSVCPDVQGVEYYVNGDIDNTYEWVVEGGVISENNGMSILVDWNGPNSSASVRLAVKNSIGCQIEDLILEVIVNKRLEPEAALSDSFIEPESDLSEVCFEDRNRVRYYVNPTNGSSYSWQVSGGSFTADTNPNSDEVFVNWGNSTTGTVWYTESNNQIDDCEGVSDILNVRIYQPIVSVPTITNVLCNGESNGSIILSLSGGKPGNYTVDWDNGMSGANISGLPVGTYEATITDAIGCVIVETYEVTEPDELLVQSTSVMPVRCFQENNGVGDIEVTGGTTFGNGDYKFKWTTDEYEVTTNSHVNSRLPAGDYVVTVTDANGCQTVASLTIEEPSLLKADLESLINEPICPQASDGTAFIDAKGGTPDYQFYWSNKPTTDDASASDLSQGAYSVRIVDANGCETSLEVDVTERFPKIFFPTAFSPNGDSENETFKPVADCQVSYYMQIYNKWGQVIFSTEDLSEGWDGTYQGDIAPEGKYSYVVFYAGSLNEVSFEETYRGSFNLIR